MKNYMYVLKNGKDNCFVDTGKIDTIELRGKSFNKYSIVINSHEFEPYKAAKKDFKAISKLLGF